jgi:hypothetical protein
MYDAQMVAVDQSSDTTLEALKISGHASRIVRALFEDFAFDQAVRQGTNTPSRVRYRISRMIEAIREQ